MDKGNPYRPRYWQNTVKYRILIRNFSGVKGSKRDDYEGHGVRWNDISIITYSWNSQLVRKATKWHKYSLLRWHREICSVDRDVASFYVTNIPNKSANVSTLLLYSLRFSGCTLGNEILDFYTTLKQFKVTFVLCVKYYLLKFTKLHQDLIKIKQELNRYSLIR